MSSTTTHVLQPPVSIAAAAQKYIDLLEDRLQRMQNEAGPTNEGLSVNPHTIEGPAQPPAAPGEPGGFGPPPQYELAFHSDFPVS